MERWLIKLEGEAISLEEFPRWFSDGEVFAFEEDKTFYLTGQVFDAHSDPKQVYDKALQVVEDYSAAISIFSPRFIKPRVTTVIHEANNGIRKQHSFVSGGFACVLIEATGKITVGTKPKKTEAQKLIEVALTDRKLMLILYLWIDTPRTWPRLYRILEEIELYLEKTVYDAGFCSKTQRDLFKRCANDATVAGKDARHAADKFEPTKKPMSLEEAEKFINILIFKAI